MGQVTFFPWPQLPSFLVACLTSSTVEEIMIFWCHTLRTCHVKPLNPGQSWELVSLPPWIVLVPYRTVKAPWAFVVPPWSILIDRSVAVMNRHWFVAIPYRHRTNIVDILTGIVVTLNISTFRHDSSRSIPIFLTKRNLAESWWIVEKIVNV